MKQEEIEPEEYVVWLDELIEFLENSGIDISELNIEKEVAE